jgi:hypothetical protein
MPSSIRESHCCGCTHATSNDMSEPEVDQALLLKRDLQLGNYLANYLNPRVQVLAEVKSRIDKQTELEETDGTIQIPTLTVESRTTKTDLGELREELLALCKGIDVEPGHDSRSVHVENFNGTGKSFDVDYKDTLSQTTPAHFLHSYHRSVTSE